MNMNNPHQHHHHIPGQHGPMAPGGPGVHPGAPAPAPSGALPMTNMAINPAAGVPSGELGGAWSDVFGKVQY